MIPLHSATSTSLRTSPRSAARSTLALVVLALASAGGCSSDPAQGYSFASAHDPSIRTVSVPIFENQTFSTGAEVQITEAVIKEIQRVTRWRVVSGSAADATLKGILTASTLRKLSTTPGTGLAQEMGVEYRVDFELVDNHSGRTIAQRRNFSTLETFAPTRTVGERLEVGQAGAAGTLARDLVAELRSGW